MSTPQSPDADRPRSRREARSQAETAAEAAESTVDPSTPAAQLLPSEPAGRSTSPASSSAPVPGTAPEPQTAVHDAATVGDRGTRRADAAAVDHAKTLTSFDELFTPEPPAPGGGARRRKRARGCLVWLIVLLVVFAGIGVGGLWVWNTYGTQIQDALGLGEPKDYETGLTGEPVTISIASGDAGAEVSQKLFAAGVTKTDQIFYTYLVDSGQNPSFYPGVYQVRTKLPAAEALAMLEEPANRLQNTLLVREGETAAAVYESLAALLEVPVADVTAAAADPSAFGVDASSLEGWLFPATYEFEPGISAHDALATLVDRMRSALDKAGVAEADRQRVLTVASIIQREARFEADFYKVSRVIENRLQEGNTETHGYLQMDSTAQYGVGQLGDGAVSSSEDALASDNPWNTYKHPGLPVGPIANPGDLAIDAALHPADGPWYYFATVNLDTGETVFSTTYAEHLAAVAQWQTWCAANPDSGC